MNNTEMVELIMTTVDAKIAEHEKRHHRRRGKLKIVPLEEPYATNLDGARRLWPGDKRGLEKEWLNFVSKHSNYRSLLDDDGLERCVQAMIVAETYSGKFWPQFSKFVNQELWELVCNE